MTPQPLTPGDSVTVKFPDKAEMIGPLRLLWIDDEANVATVCHPALDERFAKRVLAEYVSLCTS